MNEWIIIFEFVCTTNFHIVEGKNFTMFVPSGKLTKPEISFQNAVDRPDQQSCNLVFAYIRNSECKCLDIDAQRLIFKINSLKRMYTVDYAWYNLQLDIVIEVWIFDCVTWEMPWNLKLLV